MLRIKVVHARLNGYYNLQKGQKQRMKIIFQARFSNKIFNFKDVFLLTVKIISAHNSPSRVTGW